MSRLSLRTRRPVTPETEAHRQACDKVAYVYFASLGLAVQRPPDPRVSSFAYRCRFGLPEFRRAAWERARDDLRRDLPRSVFATLDDAFGPDGEALHFTYQFTLDERLRMQSALEAAR